MRIVGQGRPKGLGLRGKPLCYRVQERTQEGGEGVGVGIRNLTLESAGCSLTALSPRQVT